MSDHTKIEWADASWNPIVGCSPLSDGCKNCYASSMAVRLARMGSEAYDAVTGSGGWNGQTVITDSETWDEPLRWKKPRRIFCCSMGDLFHESIATQAIQAVEMVARNCPQHIFVWLTKRAKRMVDYEIKNPVPENVWCGVTCENQWAVNSRIMNLSAAWCKTRFVSFEPLLENIEWLHPPAGHTVGGRTNISWVIVGPETGPRRRECKIEWIENIVRQCDEADVPVFIKALPINGRISKNMDEWPPHLRRREFPR